MILLEPGKHRVSIAVPVSDVILEKEIVLKEGKNILKILPTYKASVSPGYPNGPRFSRGLKYMNAKLNDLDIRW